jgi:hypothetical protein
MAAGAARPWLLASLCACGVTEEELPRGALARVGSTVLVAEDLIALRQQVGPWARQRFSGEDGAEAMLPVVIDAELMAQDLIARGLGDDPRVRFELQEDMAATYECARLEREVRPEDVAADEAALAAYLDAHSELFAMPERRRARGVVAQDFARADELQARLEGGASLESLGEVVTTPLQARDDAQFPSFHPALFAPPRVGMPLPWPVAVGNVLLVAQVDAVEAAVRPTLADPATRDRVIAAVLAERRRC